MLSSRRVTRTICAVVTILVVLLASLLPATVEGGKKWKYLAVAAALRPPHIIPIPFPYERSSPATQPPKVVNHHHHHIAAPPPMPIDWPMSMMW